MDYTHALQLALVNAMRDEEQGGTSMDFVEKIRGHTDFSMIVQGSGQLVSAFLRKYGHSKMYRSLQDGVIGAKHAAWQVLGELRQEDYQDPQSLNSFWAAFQRGLQGLLAVGVSLDPGSDNFERVAMMACDALEPPASVPLRKAITQGQVVNTSALTQWIIYKAVELDCRPGGNFWDHWFDRGQVWSDPSGVTYKYNTKGSWAAAAKTPVRERSRDQAKGVSRQTQDREEPEQPKPKKDWKTMTPDQIREAVVETRNRNYQDKTWKGVSLGFAR